MSFKRGSSNHRVSKVIPAWFSPGEDSQNYIISWSQATKSSGRRTAEKVTQTRRTTAKGAIRFAKKHGLDKLMLPTELRDGLN